MSSLVISAPSSGSSSKKTETPSRTGWTASKSFSEFEAAHDIYHNALEIDNDIEASDAWFDAVQTAYVAGVKAAKVWLKTKAHVDPPADASTITREDLLNYMHVPNVELDKFDGNPLEYLTFIAVFDEMVDRRVADAQVKLTWLLQYTSGSVKAAIKNCALIGGEAGYEEARDILRNRYGNSHLVSQRLIAELKNGKRVVKAHDLQQLADELSMALVLVALGKLGKLGELNTQQSMIEILQRCQQHTRNRWRNKALESKRLNDEYPNFKDFTEFVQREASEACDPVYGLFPAKQREDVKGANFHTVAYAPGSGASSRSRRKPARAADSSARPCVVCGQPHRLFQCEMYKGMQPVDRFQVAKRHKLCYNCLLAGHVLNACYKQSMCTVPDCSRKHSELLHFDEADNVVHDDVVWSMIVYRCVILLPGGKALVYTYRLCRSWRMVAAVQCMRC